MAGLSERERKQIEEKHRDDLIRFLSPFPWRRVVVFSRAYESERKFVEVTYPAFRKLLAEQVDGLEDFWTTERGELGNRLHMNVLLAASRDIPAELIDSSWRLVASSRITNYEYDAQKGPRYWIKDMTSFDAGSDYGGSVIQHAGFSSVDRPRRKKKSDYQLSRRRFRPQHDSQFHQHTPPPRSPLRRPSKLQAKLDQMALARRIREQQWIF